MEAQVVDNSAESQNKAGSKLLIEFKLFLHLQGERLDFQILQQDEALRTPNPSIASLKPRGIKLNLRSQALPALNSSAVYIRGSNRRYDSIATSILSRTLESFGRTYPGAPKNSREYAKAMLELFSILGSVHGTLIPGEWSVFTVRSREQ